MDKGTAPAGHGRRRHAWRLGAITTVESDDDSSPVRVARTAPPEPTRPYYYVYESPKEQRQPKASTSKTKWARELLLSSDSETSTPPMSQGALAVPPLSQFYAHFDDAKIVQVNRVEITKKEEEDQIRRLRYAEMMRQRDEQLRLQREEAMAKQREEEELRRKREVEMRKRWEEQEAFRRKLEEEEEEEMFQKNLREEERMLIKKLAYEKKKNRMLLGKNKNGEKKQKQPQEVEEESSNKAVDDDKEKVSTEKDSSNKEIVDIDDNKDEASLKGKNDSNNKAIHDDKEVSLEQKKSGKDSIIDKKEASKEKDSRNQETVDIIDKIETASLEQKGKPNNEPKTADDKEEASKKKDSSDKAVDDNEEKGSLKAKKKSSSKVIDDNKEAASLEQKKEDSTIKTVDDKIEEELLVAAVASTSLSTRVKKSKKSKTSSTSLAEGSHTLVPEMTPEEKLKHEEFLKKRRLEPRPKFRKVKRHMFWNVAMYGDLEEDKSKTSGKDDS